MARQFPLTDAESPLAPLPTRDGQKLVRRRWRAAGAKCSVLLVHGLGEHGARYDKPAAWFNARGFDVLTYDQRGHGRSPGRRGALTHPDDLLADLATVFAEYAARFTTPPLLLGHSMGGVVAARAVLDQRLQPSPVLRSRSSTRMIRLTRLLARVAPNLPLRNGLKVTALSHDSAVVEAYRNDPLCHSKITPRLADFIFRAGAACIHDAPLLRVPTLLLVAGDDALVDPSGSSDFAAAAWATDCLTTRHFATLNHELFNEAEPGRAGAEAAG